ncbi:MAG: endonuclease/exonuclease/phosphatase family protein [Deltaproteobacteria bacterium]|nr:endonuclease/exonuclease/phosphatase family protein [Deltaproteobacteria bacterium]
MATLTLIHLRCRDPKELQVDPIDGGAQTDGTGTRDAAKLDLSVALLDASPPDSDVLDASIPDAADAPVAFARAEVFAPPGPLCDIPPSYVEDGGDPRLVSCRVETDRFSNQPEIPARVRIATWNVRFGVDSASVATTLATHPELRSADVILLQEVARFDLASNPPELNQARELARALEFDYAFAVEWDRREHEDERGEHGTAILSKFPIGNLTQIRHVALNDWWAEDQRYGGRMTLGADLLVGARVIRVYSSHLDTRPRVPSDEGRAQQGAEIRADADLEGRPDLQLVGGDLNTWTCNFRAEDCTRPPSAELVVQDFLAAGWSDGTAGFNGHTQVGAGFFRQRLDWIFVRGATVAPGTMLPDAEGSDHLPIYTELVLTQ